MSGDTTAYLFKLCGKKSTGKFFFFLQGIADKNICAITLLWAIIFNYSLPS